MTLLVWLSLRMLLEGSLVLVVWVSFRLCIHRVCFAPGLAYQTGLSSNCPFFKASPVLPHCFPIFTMMFSKKYCIQCRFAYHLDGRGFFLSLAWTANIFCPSFWLRSLTLKTVCRIRDVWNTSLPRPWRRVGGAECANNSTSSCSTWWALGMSVILFWLCKHLVHVDCLSYHLVFVIKRAAKCEFSTCSLVTCFFPYKESLFMLFPFDGLALLSNK